MIDALNALVIAAALLTAGALLIRRRGRLRAAASAVSGLAAGLALHSLLLHWKARRRLRLPWDHDEEAPP